MAECEAPEAVARTMAPPAWVVAGGRELKPGTPYGVMGILNLTPDSF